MFQMYKERGAFPEDSHFPDAQHLRYTNILSKINGLPLTNPGMPLLNYHFYQRSQSLQTLELTHSHSSQAHSFPHLLCSLQSGREDCSLRHCFLNFKCAPKSPGKPETHHQRFWFIRSSFRSENVHFHQLTNHISSSTTSSHSKSIWIAKFRISIPSVTIYFATGR